MSSDLIQADFEQLTQVGQRFAQQAEATTQLISLLQTRMSPLQDGGWQGRGADAFFTEMAEDLFPGLHRLQNALEQASQTTRHIDDILNGAQEEAASSFGQGDGSAFAPGGFSGAGSGGSSSGGGGIDGLIGNLGDQFDQIWGGQVGNLPGTNLPIGNVGGGGFWDGNGTFPGNSSLNPLDNFLNQFGFGSGTDALLGGGFAGGGTNDFGIPHDWLAGVTGAENGSSGGALGSELVPNDWLDGVLGAAGGEGSSTAVDGGGAAGGGSSGGGAGGGAPTPDTTTEPPTEASEPTSSGGSGGSSPSPTDISSPFAEEGRGFQATGGASAPASTPSSGGFTHQSATSGGGTGAAVSQEAVGTGVTAVSPNAPAAQAAAGGSNAGLAIGLAVASPLVAVLGKLITGQKD